MTPPPDPPAPDDDIDAWLDEVAGRRPTTDPVNHALRQAIAQRRATDAATDPDDDDALTQARNRVAERLRQHMQAAPAIDAPATPAVTEPSAPPPLLPPNARPAANDRRWRLVAAVAGLAIVGGLVWQQVSDEEPAIVIADGGAPVWRDLTTLPRIAVARPDQAARDLARQIAPLDTRPALYRDGANVLVDFDVQPDQMQALSSAVADTRIRAVVKPGMNRIIFTPAP